MKILIICIIALALMSCKEEMLHDELHLSFDKDEGFYYLIKSRKNECLDFLKKIMRNNKKVKMPAGDKDGTLFFVIRGEIDKKYRLDIWEHQKVIIFKEGNVTSKPTSVTNQQLQTLISFSDKKLSYQ